MREVAYAIMALSLAFSGGLATGWHWRGSSFERHAKDLAERVEAREAARRADLERQLTHARRSAALAEEAAARSDQEREDVLARASSGSADEVSAINAHIAEVNR